MQNQRRRTPMSVDISAIFAAAITAPEGSVTVPEIVPLLVCALTAAAPISTNTMPFMVYLYGPLTRSKIVSV